ncbi:MAG TPA: hypothetical protein VGO40_17380 [Longimicrobium sp.]|jgi:hypothetical protein|nr:hypothetical protein [Longimicrobium sp.]
MRNFSRLRVVLALITMLGAFHLRADASPRAAAGTMDCYSEVYSYGWNTCETWTGGNWEWGIVYYYEFPDGSCYVTSVECY